MNIDDPQIIALRAKVKAAQEEFDQATAYHESWKPAAYNAAVHAQMGTSFASTTFTIIRQALRREMLLALARLWDRDSRAVSMVSIANCLENGQIVDALAEERAGQWGDQPLHFPDSTPEEERQIITSMSREGERAYGHAEAERMREQAAKVALRIREFERGGTRHGPLEHVLQLRHEHLAHRQIRPSEPKAPSEDRDDDAIERLYQDMSSLIQALTGVVLNTDYRPKETANIYRKNAQLFWAGVRGERTEGHPAYVERPIRA